MKIFSATTLKVLEHCGQGGLIGMAEISVGCKITTKQLLFQKGGKWEEMNPHAVI